MLGENKRIANRFRIFPTDRQPITDLRCLRVSISDFEVKKIIGRGHFGEVKVVKEKATGEVFAMKTLRKNETLSQQAVAFYEEERDIMAQAQDTKWITKLHYAYQVGCRLAIIPELGRRRSRRVVLRTLKSTLCLFPSSGRGQSVSGDGVPAWR